MPRQTIKGAWKGSRSQLARSFPGSVGSAGSGSADWRRDRELEIRAEQVLEAGSHVDGGHYPEQETLGARHAPGVPASSDRGKTLARSDLPETDR
ncbi:MAG: hypothetical protein GY772_21985 [bacterium]|nr:hypothetical protein [Deltaproteobacteria bacterium]MCP4243235.1 hypothetical protein [bacterium]MDP6075451.1 hypothetical protein [Myxococcota bacterium]MDP7075665.1 hypothetical protein [Myxococcota bacterium]MDP7297893.1 hypothetical protein [Myxococcota bacterium]